MSTEATEAAGPELVVLMLYPRDMNIYGDRGNLLALTRRMRAHGFQPKVVELHRGDALPATVDIVLGGGGQDSGQARVAADLVGHEEGFRALAADGTPMLLVCGLFQLFGHRFITHTGAELRGIGVLDATTLGESERMIGNVVLQSDDLGEIIGYENHSGQTRLGPGSRPLGRVVQGDGNHPGAGVEGARTGNVIGTYLHGALLPKNPVMSDFLIAEAARRRYGEFTPSALVDTTAERARESSKRRPR